MTKYTTKEKQKCDFRKISIQRLRLSSRIAKIKKDYYINLEILKLIKQHKVKNILVYIPMDMEVNILPLIKRLRKENYKLFTPYMVDDSFKIVKYRLPLKKKKFGIYEPNNSNLKVQLDMAIVPIIAIDDTFRRVGFGKGMYDRFFAKLPYKPITIFTSLELCKCDTIITSSYDIEADYIITF